MIAGTILASQIIPGQGNSSRDWSIKSRGPGFDSCTVQSLEQCAREMKEEIILEHICVMGIKVAKGLPDRPTAWPSQGQWPGPPRGPCVCVCGGEEGKAAKAGKTQAGRAELGVRRTLLPT